MTMTLMIDSWIALGIAIIFGVLGTISMKLSHGLTNKKYIFYLAFFYTVCFIAMTFAMKRIQLSVVYAIWSGMGTLLVATIGILHFKERVSIKKILYLLLIVIGVMGINISGHFS